MSTPLPASRLGRYEVIEPIASGGMAEVFLARAVGAMGFQRLVALKLIHTNFTQDPEFVKMFIDEARIAMHLHHRNIVQVFDLDEERGVYYLAMEYIRGSNLYGLYERMADHHRWFEVPLAMYIVAQVCKGLHFAHTRMGQDGRPMAIIHRDISPQNVLLSFEGEVKITDFGIATAAERLHQTAAGIVKGKYAYMAPERLEEQPFDARVDVFSAGVLLYELLTGENPFAGASPIETIERVIGGQVEPPSRRGASVPGRLDEICMSALAPRPQDRFPSALALAEALTELAMELTYTRADMAAGDAALAAVLAELFPAERARRPGQAGAPVVLPGVEVDPASPPPFGVAPGEDTSYADEPTLQRVAVEGPLLGDTDPVSASETELPTYRSLPAHEPASDPELDATIRTLPVSPSAPPGTDPGEDTTMRGGFDPSAGPLFARSRPGDPIRDAPVVVADPAEQPDASVSLPPLGSSSRWLLVAALGLVLILGIGMLVMPGEERAYLEVPIRFESTPPGARVVVDGRPLPHLTPTRAALPAGGHHQVRFELTGHRAVETEVTVDPRRGGTVSARLEPRAESPN